MDVLVFWLIGIFKMSKYLWMEFAYSCLFPRKFDISSSSCMDATKMIKYDCAATVTVTEYLCMYVYVFEWSSRVERACLCAQSDRKSETKVATTKTRNKQQSHSNKSESNKKQSRQRLDSIKIIIIGCNFFYRSFCHRRLRRRHHHHHHRHLRYIHNCIEWLMRLSGWMRAFTLFHSLSGTYHRDKSGLLTRFRVIH